MFIPYFLAFTDHTTVEVDWKFCVFLNWSIVDLQYYVSFQVYSTVIKYFCSLSSIKSYYKIMAIIPCAVQYIFVAYIFYAL